MDKSVFKTPKLNLTKSLVGGKQQDASPPSLLPKETPQDSKKEVTCMSPNFFLLPSKKTQSPHYKAKKPPLAVKKELSVPDKKKERKVVEDIDEDDDFMRPQLGTTSSLSKFTTEEEDLDLDDLGDEVEMVEQPSEVKEWNEENEYRNNTNQSLEKKIVRRGKELVISFPLVSEDGTPPDFDPETIKTWVYPTNMILREYQYNMVKNGLFENSLVVLPTGLGKTFIAAVIIYNYYRWFPTGKIIFMAPTKPLVNQQVEACHSIVGIPEVDTIVMTGSSTNTSVRQKYWDSKRIVFATPQVIQNDLKNKLVDGKSVVLIIIDEAHKAQGAFAYCNVVSLLAACTPYFRVIGLTATPGSDVNAIQNVICNLLIGRMDVRQEEDVDVKTYIKNKVIQLVNIELKGDFEKVKTAFLGVAKIPLDTLCNLGVFYMREPARVTHGAAFMARKNFTEKRQHFHNISEQQSFQVFAMFAVLVSLYRAYDLLNSQGLKSFRKSILEFVKKENSAQVSKFRQQIVRTTEMKNLLECLEQTTESDADYPKLTKVVQILSEHFEEHQASRAIVFTQYRDTVTQIVSALSDQPLVRPSPFVGQATKAKSKEKGLSQKEQEIVIKRFVEGELNCLVATSIGEEGLDIGEVDLVICWDTQASPLRMIQRMGRTGRKRHGRCVIFVSESEESVFKHFEARQKKMRKTIGACNKNFTYYSYSPRMIPEGITPKPLKKKIEVDPETWNGARHVGKKRKLEVTSVSEKKETKKKKKGEPFVLSAKDELDYSEKFHLTNEEWDEVAFNGPCDAYSRIKEISQVGSAFSVIGHSSTTRALLDTFKLAYHLEDDNNFDQYTSGANLSPKSKDNEEDHFVKPTKSLPKKTSKQTNKGKEEKDKKLKEKLPEKKKDKEKVKEKEKEKEKEEEKEEENESDSLTLPKESKNLPPFKKPLKLSILPRNNTVEKKTLPVAPSSKAKFSGTNIIDYHRHLTTGPPLKSDDLFDFGSQVVVYEEKEQKEPLPQRKEVRKEDYLVILPPDEEKENSSGEVRAPLVEEESVELSAGGLSDRENNEPEYVDDNEEEKEEEELSSRGLIDVEETSHNELKTPDISPKQNFNPKQPLKNIVPDSQGSVQEDKKQKVITPHQQLNNTEIDVIDMNALVATSTPNWNELFGLKPRSQTSQLPSSHPVLHVDDPEDLPDIDFDDMEDEIFMKGISMATPKYINPFSTPKPIPKVTALSDTSQKPFFQVKSSEISCLQIRSQTTTPVTTMKEQSQNKTPPNQGKKVIQPKESISPSPISKRQVAAQTAQLSLTSNKQTNPETKKALSQTAKVFNLNSQAKVTSTQNTISTTQDRLNNPSQTSKPEVQTMNALSQDEKINKEDNEDQSKESKPIITSTQPIQVASQTSLQSKTSTNFKKIRKVPSTSETPLGVLKEINPKELKPPKKQTDELVQKDNANLLNTPSPSKSIEKSIPPISPDIQLSQLGGLFQSPVAKKRIRLRKNLKPEDSLSKTPQPKVYKKKEIVELSTSPVKKLKRAEIESDYDSSFVVDDDVVIYADPKDIFDNEAEVSGAQSQDEYETDEKNESHVEPEEIIEPPNMGLYMRSLSSQPSVRPLNFNTPHKYGVNTKVKLKFKHENWLEKIKEKYKDTVISSDGSVNSNPSPEKKKVAIVKEAIPADDMDEIEDFDPDMVVMNLQKNKAALLNGGDSDMKNVDQIEEESGNEFEKKENLSKGEEDVLEEFEMGFKLDNFPIAELNTTSQSHSEQFSVIGSNTNCTPTLLKNGINVLQFSKFKHPFLIGSEFIMDCSGTFGLVVSIKELIDHYSDPKFQQTLQKKLNTHLAFYLFIIQPMDKSDTITDEKWMGILVELIEVPNVFVLYATDMEDVGYLFKNVIMELSKKCSLFHLDENFIKQNESCITLLTSLPGISIAHSLNLLQRFKNLKNIFNSDVETLVDEPIISHKLAQHITRLSTELSKKPQ